MLDFPNAPTTNQVFAIGALSWQWDGTKWIAVSGSMAGYAPINAPVFTGDARAVTPATADSDTSIATTAYVQAQGYATSASVTAAVGLRVLKAGDTMTGSLTVNGAVLVADAAGTGTATFEVGSGRSGDGIVLIDLHAQPSTDYNLRLYRGAGANGTAQLINAGAGAFQILNSAGVELSGTGTNNNATAGAVGEYIESNIPAASGTLATSAVVLNVTSISLTAGDWDVCGSVFTIPTAGCVLTDFRGAVSFVSGAVPDQSRYAAWLGSMTNPSLGLAAPQQRISIAVTTVIYLVSYQVFTAAALRIAGTISARRVR